jgi:hypothetical protein
MAPNGGVLRRVAKITLRETEEDLPVRKRHKRNSRETEAEAEWPVEGVLTVDGDRVLLKWKPTWVGRTD